MEEAKPFSISKCAVWEGYKKVRANGGSAGVDGITLKMFEKDLKANLYKIWNRMSSGSYYPQAVRRVNIPKADGKVRPLGIPVIADRIAQMVVKQELEVEVEKVFHMSSYGYRPKRSAKDAVSAARRNCWKYDWVLDIDIKGFFDTIDHELMMKAVRKHTQSKWIILYVDRWLKAPVQMSDGSLEERTTGTPQGGVVSPLLANLFLHYAFDMWMQRNNPELKFERYADDIVCHCKSKEQAEQLKQKLEQRMRECHLELHPNKTKIVYCKDDDRRQSYPETFFDFLGFTFRVRRAKNRWGKYFNNFSPAASEKALKTIRQTMRSWKIQRMSGWTIEEISKVYNPRISGWINYYGSFYKSELDWTLRCFDNILLKWAMKKYKNLKKKLATGKQMVGSDST